MKNSLLLMLFTFVTAGTTWGQNGYSYTVTVKGMEDTILLLGHNYADKQYVVDTAQTDASGKAVFSGDKPLPGGVYMIVMHRLANKYFELIVDEPSFSITTDASDITGKMVIEGSEENQLMYEDLRFIAAQRQKVDRINKELETLDAGDSKRTQLEAERTNINDSVLAWRARIFEQYPDAFYTKMLKAAQDVVVPEAPVKADGTTDKYFGYYYVRQHFFDDIDLQDPRLIRTNIVPGKLERYFEYYVPKVPDSVIVAVDKVAQLAKGNNDMFQYIIVTLLNKYATSDIMGMDAVFVHIVDTYYKTGDAFWLDDAGLFRITHSADMMRPTLIGKRAPNIFLQDTADRDIPLYAINSDYTIILFWDVDCSHCKKDLPKIEAAYPQLKEMGAEIYAVYSQEELDKWENWLREHQYGWVNVGNKKLKSNFQVIYNVNQTPIILIIDKEKNIIARKIGADQLVDFLQRYKETHEK